MPWFIVRCVEGEESEFRGRLESRVRALGLSGRISRVIVPVEKTTEIRSGRKTVTERPSVAGLLLIEMILDDVAALCVRQTDGVTAFDASNPMTARDAERWLLTSGAGTGRPRIRIEFRSGRKHRQ